MRSFLAVQERSFRPALEILDPLQPAATSKDMEKLQPATVTDASSSSSNDSSSDSSSSDDDSSDDSDDPSDDPSIPGKTAPPTNGASPTVISNGDFGNHMDLDRAEALRNGTTETEISGENEPALNFGKLPKDKHRASYIISGTSESPANESPDRDSDSSFLETIARRQLAAQSAPKRARLNIDGAKRVIFGNLGQRTPRTKADEERVRAKLADVGKSKKAAEDEKEEKEVEAESEAWRSKVRVMACECIDKGIVLSEPPYPFQQRWDPQQQHWQGKKKGRNKKKRKSHDGNYDEIYDEEYEGDGYEDSILLKYNEEDVSAIQVVDENAEQQEDTANLPSLPKDISTLPTADLDDLEPGTIIVFKQLEIGANFMPNLSHHKTAIVEPTADLGTVEKGFLLLRLAARDRKVKEERRYDAKGNRVYKKFEMPMSDEEDNEEEEDDGVVEAMFKDLVDVRILKMARVTESEAVDDAAAQQLRVEAEAGLCGDKE